MCILSGSVSFVGGTKLFARAPEPGRQVLVYSMTLGAASDLAMVLPLPVPVGSGEDAVRFIDLSAYPTLFADLAVGFPPPPLSGGIPSAAPAPTPRSAPLVVHEVGAFRASFVPTRADFSRLDPCFTVADEVWDALPAYADWGFAVFELRDWSSGRRKNIHPMAFEFPTRDPSRLFYPTVHVHEGTVSESAAFDHELYWQSEAPPEGFVEQTQGNLDRYVDTTRTAGLIDGARPGFRRMIQGQQTNRDIWMPC